MISDKNRNPGNLDVTTLMSGNLDHSPSSSPWEPGSPSTHEYINPIYFCWHTFRMLSHLKNIWNISFLRTTSILIKSSSADTHSERNLWNISKCIQFDWNLMNISTKLLSRIKCLRLIANTAASAKLTFKISLHFMWN